jgi:hypothetical protein
MENYNILLPKRNQEKAEQIKTNSKIIYSNSTTSITSLNLSDLPKGMKTYVHIKTCILCS